MMTVTDLFCGAGGVTSGIEAALFNGQKIAEVIQAVNHDPLAIASHAENHKGTCHFIEDITVQDEKKLLKSDILWASIECTNFSNAKGGKPRDADSRTLAQHLIRYIKHLEPSYIIIENVREFLAWGPLDKHGKPESRTQGRDYLRWVESIKEIGYEYEYRLLNAADYGAYTSRLRYFGIFAKKGLPISFPAPTHAKNPVKAHLFDKEFAKWKPVKEVLDFTDEGNSIFGRKKPLSEKTLARIYAGLIKYVAGGKDSFTAKLYAVSSTSTGTGDIDSPAHTITTKDGHALVNINRIPFIVQRNSGEPESRVSSIENPGRTLTTTGGNQEIVQAFISKYYSGKPENKNISIDGPAGTITCVDGQSLVNVKHIPFIMQSNGGEPSAKVSDIESPARTITASDNKSLVKPCFLTKFYGNGDNVSSIEEPAGTVTTKDRFTLVQAEHWLDKQYGSGDLNHQSVYAPAGTIMNNDKHCLVSADKFMMLNYSTGQTDKSIEEPASAITTTPKHNIVSCKPFLLNPQWGINSGSDINEPCFTLIARMDKAPPYLVVTEAGELGIVIYDTDSEYTVKIKEFMALYCISDIKMRMLKVPELLKIQGFPNNYILKGNQSHQKKFIGNAVVPIMAQRIIEALYAAVVRMGVFTALFHEAA